MRRFLLVPVSILLLPLYAIALIEVVVETRTFHIPGKGPRVEVNMAVMGGTAIQAPNERGFMQARVEAVTIVEQNGTIKAFSKVAIDGPERLDSIHTDILHQEFFDLAPGAYELFIEVRDLNSSDTTATRFEGPLAVGALPEAVSVSDILLAERIDRAGEGQVSKYGYLPIPLLSDYYPSSIPTIDFYAEVYNTDRAFGVDSLYMLTYQLENYEKRTVHGPYKRVTRAKGRPVEPVIAQFDIRDLPSGNYLLAVEVRDKQGNLMARSEQFLRRNNPIVYSYDLQSLEQFDVTNTFAGAFSNVDTLAEHIRSMRPIADPLERKIIDDRWKDRNMELMKRFFFSFWANRSAEPEMAWKEYRAQVIKVNQAFGCRLLRGHETDRGYVYLKYGAPNTITDRFNEMDALPYTIWHYYRAGKYTNRRFVFYQPELANNCMELIHSEVPGEISNPRWNQIIHSRNVAMPNVDPQAVPSQSGDRALEFYEIPR